MSAEYYLELFDRDFTEQERKSGMRKKELNDIPVISGPLDILVKCKPVSKVKEKSVWSDSLLLQKPFGEQKTLDKWNRLDLRKYVGSQYKSRWKDTLGYASQHALVNEIIAKIEHFLRTTTEQDGYPILKEYFDCFIEKLVPLASKEKGGMDWRKFSYDKYLFKFFEYWKSSNKTPKIIPEEKVKVEEQLPLSLDDLDTAYETSPMVLLREFGVVLTINYLIMNRNKSVDKSLSYVRSVSESIPTSSMKDVFVSTEKYQPYPKWLSFTDVDEILSELSVKSGVNKPSLIFSDNESFSFLREKV